MYGGGVYSGGTICGIGVVSGREASSENSALAHFTLRLPKKIVPL